MIVFKQAILVLIPTILIVTSLSQSIAFAINTLSSSNQNTPETATLKDNSVFRDDEHFAKVITLSRPKIKISEAISLLSQQAGVSMTLHSPSDYTDRNICIVCQNDSLRSVSEALASLLSYKTFGYRWLKKKKDGADIYVLTEYGDVEKARDALRSQADGEFVKAMENAAAAVNYSDEQLKRYGKKINELFFLSTGDAENLNRWRSGMKAFYQGLTDEQRQSILQGKPVTVLTNSHPTFGEFVNAENPSRNQGASPVPKSITFTLSREPNELPPCLNINVANSFAYNYIGGPFTEETWQNRIGIDWITRHDLKTQEIEKKDIPVPDIKKMETVEKELGKDKDNDSLALLIWRITNATKLPIIALRPPETPGVTVDYVSATPSSVDSEPYGKPLKQILDGLRPPGLRFQYKWREGVLLLRNPVEPFLPPRVGPRPQQIITPE